MKYGVSSKLAIEKTTDEIFKGSKRVRGKGRIKQERKEETDISPRVTRLRNGWVIRSWGCRRLRYTLKVRLCDSGKIGIMKISEVDNVYELIIVTRVKLIRNVEKVS